MYAAIDVPDSDDDEVVVVVLATSSASTPKHDLIAPPLHEHPVIDVDAIDIPDSDDDEVVVVVPEFVRTLAVSVERVIMLAASSTNERFVMIFFRASLANTTTPLLSWMREPRSPERHATLILSTASLLTLLRWWQVGSLGPVSEPSSAQRTYSPSW